MKLKHLLENEQMYQIVSHEVLQSDADINGISKKGSVYVTGEQLERLFGAPKTTSGDYKYEWIVEFVYRDNATIYKPEEDEEDQDVDKTVVVIYDNFYNTGDDYRLMDEWSVGSRNLVGLWVLEQYIENNT